MRNTKKKLEELGEKVLKDIEKSENPYINVPIRSLSNIVYDGKTGMLKLGEKSSKRFLFHVGHAKKFMQTMLVAAFCKQLLEENIHTSLRDLFYALKRTLPNSEENTFDEQIESDPIVVDLEVMLDVLREQLHLNADVRGRVVGDVTIKDRGDIINWAKLGSGGWAIPSNVEDVEFKKVDAKYIIVIEKNAAFERLHEDNFWKKHKCILVTTQGQAARGTRRLIQRLSTEFNLPVYVFTDGDSIPPEEIVIIKDRNGGKILIDEIGKLLKPYLKKNKKKEIIELPWDVLAMDKNSGKIEWKPIDYAYRHKIEGELLEITTRGRGIIKVTPSHSLFVFRNGKIEVVKAETIKEGDYLIVARSLPTINNPKRIKKICLAKILKEILDEKKSRKIYAFINGKKYHLSKIELKDAEKVEYLQCCNGYQKIKNNIEVNEDFAWLIGLWVAEGDLDEKYVRFHLSRKEDKILDRLLKILEELNLEVTFKEEGKNKNGICVSVGSSIFSKLFSWLKLKNGSKTKEIPEIILNSNERIQTSFLKGLFDGDGSIDKHNDLVYFTKSKKLAKQVINLLLSLSINPTVLENSKGHTIRVPYTRVETKIKNVLFPKKKILIDYTNDGIYGLPNFGDVKKISIFMMNNFSFPYSIKNKLINQERIANALENFKIPERFKEIENNLNPILNGMVTLVKVKKIRKTKYSGDVFDLSVPEWNSFIGGNGIVFHNSYGWYIYSVIKYGSMSLAHVSDRLGTPNAKFIGLTISDIDKFDLKNYTIRAKEVDIKRAKEMLNYEWFKHPAWQKELKLMIQRKIKAELEALSGRGLKFITEVYLPEKIKNNDFLP